VSAADLVIVHKSDGLDAEGLERVRGRVAEHAPPSVKVVSAAHGQLPLEVVLGLRSAAEEAIDARHTHHDDDHAAGRPHSHELFDTITVQLPALPRERLLRGLERALQEHEVYRAKGFAAVEGKPMRLVVQAVGSRIDGYFDRPWQPGEPRTTQLVLIGAHLDRERVAKSLRAGAAG
jgi:cobalamin biosynthesis protein CobW